MTSFPLYTLRFGGAHFLDLDTLMQAAWEELIERCEEVGVDAFEINFSCPHGMPERRMGMAMGQDCELLEVRITALTGSSNQQM